jgi:hypothetical protein
VHETVFAYCLLGDSDDCGGDVGDDGGAAYGQHNTNGHRRHMFASSSHRHISTPRRIIISIIILIILITIIIITIAITWQYHRADSLQLRIRR